ncbi:MAG TPA: thiamine phosphate synthase [bacterium]|nr:thiamine phosphate synthase [bacterium]
MGSISKLERARLYLVAGAGNPQDHAGFKSVEDAVEGGVDILQLRDYSLKDSELLAMAHKFRALTRRYRILFIVNNRPDIARLSDADGVHVGQDDLTVAQVRKIIGEGKVVGVSTHSLDQAQKAISDGADYIGVGPVYPTPTKEGRPAVGLEYVRQVAGLHPSIPFFAIGGIHLSNIEEVLRAGAMRLAVVRAITEAKDPKAAAEGLQKALDKGLAKTARS